MRYALLIYGAEPTEPMSDALVTEMMTSYDVFTDEIRASGALQAGEALHPTASATTVRVQDGQVLTTDGPFAETKEALGGLYIVSAADLDEAIAMAAKIPGARYGSIEVRPIMERPDMAADPRAAEAAVTH
jgi:hypothetical protein